MNFKLFKHLMHIRLLLFVGFMLGAQSCAYDNGRRAQSDQAVEVYLTRDFALRYSRPYGASAEYKLRSVGYFKGYGAAFNCWGGSSFSGNNDILAVCAVPILVIAAVPEG